MLGKKVCKKCHKRKEFYKKYSFPSFETCWKNNVVYCPKTFIGEKQWWGARLEVKPISITSEPPEKCEYTFEHVVDSVSDGETYKSLLKKEK